MKAVVCTAYGAPEVLKVTDVQKPIVKSKELLVRVKATTVNSGDVRVRGLDVNRWMRFLMRLVLGFTKPRKPILGTVFSGIVEAVDEKVSQFKPGDEVFGMTGFNFGTYAEYVVVHEDSSVILKPEGVSFESAAAVVFGGSTALHFLQKGNLGKAAHQNVLIYGATGAVGSSAIQVAKYYNAEVTAVCSTSGLELARKLGADIVINYQQTDFKECNQTFDIILDAVGKTNKKECHRLLKANGVFLTVGGMDVASETKQQLEILKQMFEEGRLHDVIDKSYSMDQIVEAHHYVDSGHKKGNVVIMI